MSRSLIHLMFILVYGVRYGSNCVFFQVVSLFQVASQLSYNHL